jgi:hypothetical protein
MVFRTEVRVSLNANEGGRPGMGQELIELLNRVLSDLREHILEPCERIDHHPFAVLGGGNFPFNEVHDPPPATMLRGR